MAQPIAIFDVIYICAFVFTPFLMRRDFEEIFLSAQVWLKWRARIFIRQTMIAAGLVTEPKTSILFFLGTTESTKNRRSRASSTHRGHIGGAFRERMLRRQSIQENVLSKTNGIKPRRNEEDEED